jgi:hypothetical protein
VDGQQGDGEVQPGLGSLARARRPRDPTRRVGIPKEAAMESDARSTTHPIQQPVATEAEAGSAFDEITYKKGQSFVRMLESFLGEEVSATASANTRRATSSRTPRLPICGTRSVKPPANQSARSPRTGRSNRASRSSKSSATEPGRSSSRRNASRLTTRRARARVEDSPHLFSRGLQRAGQSVDGARRLRK